jgi:hypothetical protein
MTSIRRRLRLWVTAWLVVQAASLSALVPHDCCLAHRPAETVKPPTCHEKAAAEQVPVPKCSMRENCAGPLAVLLQLLSNHGVLTASLEASPDLTIATLPLAARENVITQLSSPDPPPPKA